MMKLTKLSKLKKIKSIKRTKPVKKCKRVKKNTLYRKFRAWDLRIDRLQQQRPAVRVKSDDTVRTCSNCGEVYKGRLCPQCGQSGVWMRYTWKQAMLNLLDIWGLGNRPMFRTIRELFVRPGYMIRDYLLGHRNFYFPPFKLLAVTVVLLILAFKLAGVEYVSLISELAKVDISELPPKVDVGAEGGLSSYMRSIAEAGLLFFKFLASSMLYEILFYAIFAGASIWIAFRHVKRFTFVETYIFLIFVLSQQLLLRIPWAVGTWLGGIIENQALLHDLGGVASAAGVFWTFLLVVGSVIAVCYSLAVLYLLVLDFRQFYGLKWKATIKYLLVTCVVMGLLVSWVVALLAAIVMIQEIPYMWLVILGLILLAVSFVLVDRFLTRNDSLVPRTVIRVCKFSMLSVLMIVPLGIYMYNAGFNLVGACALLLLYVALAVAVSLLPIYLYRKFHRTWIACLPLLLTILLMNLGSLIE